MNVEIIIVVLFIALFKYSIEDSLHFRRNFYLNYDGDPLEDTTNPFGQLNFAGNNPRPFHIEKPGF